MHLDRKETGFYLSMLMPMLCNFSFCRLKNVWYAQTRKQLFFFNHVDTCVLVKVSSL